MTFPKVNKSFIARHRLRFGLGAGIMGTFLIVFNLLTFAKVWEQTFAFYHIPPLVIYISMPLLYLGVCWYIGYIYDTKGFWGMENSHINTRLNAEFDTLCTNTKDIVSVLSAVSSKMESLNSKIEILENELKNKDKK